MKKLFLLLAISFFFSSPASAQTNTVCHGKVVPISKFDMVLYKPENIHGGRGPTFLVQDPAQRTGKSQLQIRNARCEPIAVIGLFATDEPFGARYYMRTWGTGQDSDELYALAAKVGSPNILIEGVNGTWIRMQDPRNREGSVRK